MTEFHIWIYVALIIFAFLGIWHAYITFGPKTGRAFRGLGFAIIGSIAVLMYCGAVFGRLAWWLFAPLFGG